jgi:negative regulator of sigma E activity
LAGLSAPLRAEDPRKIVLAGLRSPTASFSGTRMVIAWYGDGIRAQKIRVRYRPARHWRQEILSPTDDVQRVILRKDQQEWQYDPESRQVVHRPAEMGLPRDELEELVFDNYTPVSLEREAIGGVLCDVVELIPRHEGSPRRTLWVETGSGIVVKTKQETADGTLVYEAQFVDLNRGDPPAESLFDPESFDAAERFFVSSRDRVESSADLVENGFRSAPWLQRLSNGFRLEGVSWLPLGDDRAVHYRYSDGLGVLSLFLSPRPIEFGDDPVVSGGADHEDPTFAVSSALGNLISWEQDGRYYLLIGDLTLSALRGIQSALGPPVLTQTAP